MDDSLKNIEADQNVRFNLSTPTQCEDVERILCAAVWVKDKKQHPHQPINICNGYVIAGRRHSDCYYVLKMLGIDREFCDFENEGFLTSANRFLTRSEASVLAKMMGQLIISYYPSELRSEDLYLNTNPINLDALKPNTENPI